jgi:hypothetical protein
MSSAVIVKSKLPAEKRIELVHVSLMRNPKFAFFVGLFMVGSTKVHDDPHMTAFTNGRDAGYGRQFVDTLTDKELAFLVMHENMHKCYRHLTTWKALNDINHRIAGAACDYVINIQLVDMDPDEEFIAFPVLKYRRARWFARPCLPWHGHQAGLRHPDEEVQGWQRWRGRQR